MLERPILKALRSPNAVLLIDEIDRADDEFEAFLLEVLSTFAVTIPEYGEVRAATPPMVVLTSNRTRELHDALKRRCLYHWIDHPQLAREVEIIRTRLPDVSAELATQVASAVQRIRASDDILKPPGVAESLDWARALQRLGHDQLDVAVGRRDPRCGAEVPRGRRAGPARPRRDPCSVTADDRPGRAQRRTKLLVGFADVLRAAGMAVTPDRTSAFVEAVALTGFDDRAATYWSGRATLCSSLDDNELYDRAFTAWFTDSPEDRAGRPRRPRRQHGSRRRR